MNDLLRNMLRYHGISEAMVFAGAVESNDLTNRWIRRAAVRAEASCEDQLNAIVRAKKEAQFGFHS